MLGGALNAVLGGQSADVAEYGWGENDAAKARSAFGEELEAVERLATGHSFTLRVGDAEVTLPPPDEYEAEVSAPNRPESLGGEEVEGHLDLTWVRGRSGGDDEV
ncbi:amphi-Trp domain-containing protein [Halosimplex sp. TS25]|uniref:amphi-Trp domain-containing protein n=1 Tax=Halosimplex rarum TaxID=3396619 RepID=UPI0039E91B51